MVLFAEHDREIVAVPEARHVAVLAPETCACLAGLIDGEETIAHTREHHGENRGWATAPNC